MWPSGVMGDQIVARLGEHRYPFPFVIAAMRARDI